MAIPKPKPEEKEKEFITRAMKNSEMIEKYPDEKEREAACGKLFKKKNGKSKKDQMRIDYLSSDNNQNFMIDSFKKDKDGFLKGRAIITNVGVFPYLLEDGTVFYELRPPEEVFDEESMKSFQMLPLTNDHPSEIVNKENIKKYQVGYLGDSIYRDEYHLSAPIMITDEEAVMDVEEGKTGLSNGYTCDVEIKPGVWMGIPYDGIQRNIRGNHVAIVSRGRAGDAAKIRMDSVDVGVQKIDQNFKKGARSMALKKINIDGVDYEAESDVIKAYNQTKDKLDGLDQKIETLSKENTTLKAKNDQYESDIEQLKADNEKLKKQSIDQDKIDEAVKEKMVVLDAAKRADVEISEDSTNMQIKKDIILKLYPNAKDKLDDADDVYIDARFDMVLEQLDTKDESNMDAFVNDTVDKGDTAKNKKSKVNDAYQKMVDRQKNAWDKEDK